jgi:uncharacterized protein YggT (Ycf19 family)
MQPAPDPNQAPADPSALPTVPLISQQQGVAGGRGLMPVQSTVQSSSDLPSLPMKRGQDASMPEVPEAEDSQETTEVETFYSSEVDAPTSPAQRLRRSTRTIRFIVAVIEIVLALRFFLKLIGANPASPFGSFLYGLTDPLAAPFESLLANPTIGSGEVEFTTLLALVVYPVFGWILARSIQLMFYREQGGLRIVRHKQHTD